MTKGDDFAALQLAAARYPLRLFHPASLTALVGNVSGTSSSGEVCAWLCPPMACAGTTSPHDNDALAAWRRLRSPFRFVADARVRATLCDAAAHGTNTFHEEAGRGDEGSSCGPRWNRIDRLCHQPPAKKSKTKAAVRAGARADESVNGSTVPSKRARDDDGVALPRPHLARPHGGLASRIDENDDLLGDLLGEDINPVATPAQPPEACHAVPPQHSGGPSVDARPNTATTRSASPPRTTFRYHASHQDAQGTSVVETESSQPPLTQNRRRRRRVAAFDAFVAAQQVDEACTVGEDKPLPTTHRRRLAKAAESDAQEARNNVPWRVLVDHRERVKGSNAQMLAALRRQKVACAPCALPCGDFMVSFTAPHATTPASGTNEVAASATGKNHHRCHDGDVCGADEATQAEAEAEASASPLLRDLANIVVERKTADDLDASIKGSRYLEQRRLLACSPFTRVVWLVEGEPRAYRHPTHGGYAYRSRPGSHTPSPPPTSSAGSALGHDDGNHHDDSYQETHTARDALGVDEVLRRLDAACASLCLSTSHAQSGFTVVRTRDVHESVAFLKQLADDCVREAALDRHAPSAAPWLTAQPVFDQVRRLQQHLRAQTAFPRVLMCIRGCSATLALWMTMKYGTLLGLWRLLQTRGRAAVDEDIEVQQLPITHKKVLVLLTEFLLATEYF